MDKVIIGSLLTVIGVLWYTFLFWHSGVGLNIFLFDLFALAAVALTQPEFFRQRPAVRAAAGLLLAAFLVVLNHSVLARVVHTLFLIAYVGFAQRRELRFLFYALVLGLAGIAAAWLGWLRALIGGLRKQVAPARNDLLRWLGPALAPFAIGAPFLFLYYQANDHFAGGLDRIGELFGNLWQWSLDPWMIYISTLATLLTCSLLWPLPWTKWLSDQEAGYQFKLLRRRVKHPAYLPPRPVLGLRQEYRSALLSLGVLNGLLFLVNLTDLRFLWLDFGAKSPQELSAFVHEGTWLLIFSIGLAMLVVLIFFRRNLNFFRLAGPLRRLTYIWLAQNALLAASVGLRNGHYIAAYGLAYGRVVVLVFLLIVLFGLWTLYIKVRFRRTIFYLLHTNGWIIAFTLLLVAAVNWDLVITRYNLSANTQEPLDVQQLVGELGAGNYFLLARHRETLQSKSGLSDHEIDQYLRDKEEQVEWDAGHDWRSWNWPAARNGRYLNHKN